MFNLLQDEDENIKVVSRPNYKLASGIIETTFHPRWKYLLNKLFNIIRCLDSFQSNAFAQIEMSAYCRGSNAGRLQIADFVFSSRTKEVRQHILWYHSSI